jgi:hypothetical protein
MSVQVSDEDIERARAVFAASGIERRLLEAALAQDAPWNPPPRSSRFPPGA